jgi:hypothetical protein
MQPVLLARHEADKPLSRTILQSSLSFFVYYLTNDHHRLQWLCFDYHHHQLMTTSMFFIFLATLAIHMKQAYFAFSLGSVKHFAHTWCAFVAMKRAHCTFWAARRYLDGSRKQGSSERKRILALDVSGWTSSPSDVRDDLDGGRECLNLIA